MLLRVVAGCSILLSAVFSNAAHADNWGCEVLLCLANPAGPMAVSQCVSPIQKLYAAIFKPKPDPFPTCTMATSEDGTQSYANVEYNNYYDSCPAGTTALASGSNAVQGTPAQIDAQNNARRGENGPFTSFFVGIGDGEGASVMRREWGPKVCVGNAIGAVKVIVGNNSKESEDLIPYSKKSEDSITYQVSVYDRVAFVDRQPNGFAIKVFMNNNLYRTIRPKF